MEDFIMQGVGAVAQMFKPPAIIKHVEISMEMAYNGGKIPITVERNIREGHGFYNETTTLYVDIFPGIDDNELIVLQKEGNEKNVKGDVKVFVRIRNENSHFERKGLDLIYVKHLSLKESLCGFSFQITTLEKKQFLLKSTENKVVVQPGQEKVIQNMGMIREGQRGDLIIRFIVDFPVTLEQTVRDKLNEIL